jgi:predicted exporter
MKSIKINFPFLIAVLALMAALLAIAFFRIEIETDITKYLPQKDPVISDAEHVFKNHPIQDRLIIDIGLQKEDATLLLACGRFVEQKLTQSGLFKQVGVKDFQNIMPDLMNHVLNNLPILFDETELQDKVAPLLTMDKVTSMVQNHYNQLLDLEGIGRAKTISKDPLGLSNIVLGRLSSLSPSKNVRFYGGQIISPDGKHLLLIATPSGSGTDTAFGRNLMALLSDIGRELNDRFGDPLNNVVLTPMGAYRAALDNEIIARQDSERAILLASLGIALLLIFAFPRPLLGLFAFLPALFGSIAAFFVLALLERSISIMALGFGGAIIAITVDHGIAFLLFLDRPQPTRGRTAAREIWSVGLLAALTTMGAFGALMFCDFPIFQQLGRFTALGIGFSFLFVHVVFPLIFPEMPPAPVRSLPLRKGVKRLTGLGSKSALAMGIFAFVMVFFARPEFLVSLNAMNTVSEETRDAEKTFNQIWGQEIFENIFLMMEGSSVPDLQARGDNLLPMLTQDFASGVLLSGFIPSMVFPGEKRAKKNIASWRSFWDSERVAHLKESLKKASVKAGFTPEAYAPFLKTLKSDQVGSTRILPEFHGMLSITKNSVAAPWVQFSNLKPGPAYNPSAFYDRYGKIGKVFDPGFFSKKLGGLLFSTFLNMLWIIGLSVVFLLFIYFLDWRLVLVALIPVVFAMTCTLGTLKLIGHPLDIPGLMLSIVVIGMGIDYSLFMVRGYQRYGDENNSSFQLIKMAVFMASFSTIIGFGVLCFAQHALLRSAGLTSLLGIVYSLAGAFVILPPILKFLFRETSGKTQKPLPLHRAVLRRYRNMEAYARCFARFKMMTDPMFKELPRFWDNGLKPRIILDIGTGYGVPACWLLEQIPKAKIFGIDPDGERVRVASRVVGERGEITQGAAPQIPIAPGPADGAIMLDMIHYLSDDALNLTLKRLHMNLLRGGCLLIRVAIPTGQHHSWLWKLEILKSRLSRLSLHYRPIEKLLEMLAKAGFEVKENTPSGSKGESVWLVAENG